MAIYTGRTALIKISTNGLGGGSANWVTIGQQRGGSLARSSDVVDATTKGDSGWPKAVITRTPWSVACDGALDPADATWVYLLQQWEAKTKPYIQVDETAIGGPKKEGQAIITKLDHDFPEPDLVTFSIDFQGDGALTTSP